MLEAAIAVLIFCIVLFMYLHIYFHLKTSNDLEVYEIEQPSKDRLEEVCDVRQPVLFDYINQRLIDNCTYDALYSIYSAFDIKLRDVYDNDDETDMYVPVTFKVANEVFKTDAECKFISENNKDFLEETGILKSFQYNDAFLRPYMVSSCLYDFIIGTKMSATPLRYEVNYRNYFLTTHGHAKVVLIPPKYGKYLYGYNDYENFEFRSPVNPWNVQHVYKPDFDKIKTLEVDVYPGKMLHIPAFWWYSIQLIQEHTSVCVFKYRTYMNNIAIAPKLAMNLLQHQNVKREIEKKANSELITLKMNQQISRAPGEDLSKQTGNDLQSSVPLHQSAPLQSSVPLHQSPIQTQQDQLYPPHPLFHEATPVNQMSVATLEPGLL